MDIVRKFEVRAVDASTLRSLETDLKAAAKKRGIVPDIERVTEPPLLKVRLPGDAAAVSEVAKIVEGTAGARMLYDILKLDDPGAAPSYPDRKQLLRMDAYLAQGPMGLGGAEDTGGDDVTVAIVDTGMMIAHPDLARNVWTRDIGGKNVYGFRFINGTQDNDVTDEDGHGTQLAGTVLSGANQSPTVKIMPLKYFDGSTRPAAANAAKCIDLAVEYGAHILLLSFDVGIPDAALEQAIARAAAAGLLIVIAAGNDGADNDRFPSVPSCYAVAHPDNAIVVMATDRFDERASFSNYGSATVHIAAPGVRIKTTTPFLSDPAKGYCLFSGTSAAAAHVAGAAALYKSHHPKVSAGDLKKRLLDAVKTFDYRLNGDRLKCTSRGRLNIGKL